MPPLHQRHPYLLMQDLIGDKNTWPYLIKYWLFNCDYTYSGRVKLASFFYVNGAPIDVVITLLKRIRGLSVRRELKVRALYIYWNDRVHGRARRSRYYAFDLHIRRFTDLNGNIRAVRPVAPEGYNRNICH